MIFALAVNGTRGDVEPLTALARELAHRGHEVRIGVPPNLIGLVESVGLTAVPYGPDTQELLDDEDNYQKFWQIQNTIKIAKVGMDDLRRAWADMAATMKTLADGADMIVSGMIHQGIAANVAEYYDIPLATLHFLPARLNGHTIPMPAWMNRALISSLWWLHAQITGRVENSQRRELGLPKAGLSSTQRILRARSLEIQAYDNVLFPGLAADWAQWSRERPFVGALTMQLPTPYDDEVLSWIADGTPPIYFGFGSMPVETPAETVATIAAACAELGERALICTSGNDFTGVATFEHVKLVPKVSHAAVFPACRAVVHHGGAGTTAAGVRAGVPTLILWIWIEQPIWSAQIKRLGIGSGRRLSATTPETLCRDLQTILDPACVANARQIARRMTPPGESVTLAADLVEDRATHERTSGFAK